MKYLTQISIKEKIKKIASNTFSVYFLNLDNDLFVGEKRIKSDIFDFVITNDLLLTTNAETGDLYISRDGIESILKGNFYLKSLLFHGNSFFIANGYKADGFHFNYELIDFVTLIRKPFEQVFNITGDVFFNRTSTLIRSFNINLKQIWQTDISQYGEKRYNRHGEEIDPNTPNTVNGELMGYDDTVVVPLAGGQLLGLKYP